MKAFFLTLACGGLLLAVGGWIANIVKLASMDHLWPLTGLSILRVVGIFLAPIGAILGFC